MAASSSTAAPPLAPSSPWTELPEDLTMNILQRLGAEEILECAERVCTTWWRVCKNPAMWRVVDLGYGRCTRNNLDYICRRAVDYSQGQLVDLKLHVHALQVFQVPWLLKYINQRSSQLRRLEFSSRDVIGPALIEELIKNLPQLEELKLFLNQLLQPEDLETIGVSCPMLETFSYGNSWRQHPDISKYDIAIGKTMPNLCLLRLLGRWEGNKDVEVILDGCPHLEVLQLHQSGDFLILKASRKLMDALSMDIELCDKLNQCEV